MTKESLRIIFYGTPDFAVSSLDALTQNSFNVVAVVTAPDKPAGRGMQLQYSDVKKYAVEHNIPVLQPTNLKSKKFVQQLTDLQTNLQVIVAFRMLPDTVWSLPVYGTINVHASLLPQYRGAAPINWAIMNGETETGITTFKLKHEIDTGNILLQTPMDIQVHDNFGELYNTLKNTGAATLIQTINGLIDGTVIEKPQTENNAELKKAPKINTDTCFLNWQQTSQQAYNHIRGLSPYPAAFTFIDENKKLKIFNAEPVTNSTMHDEVGTVYSDGKTYLAFKTTDGFIKATDIQLQGKKRMPVQDFLRGYKFLTTPKKLTQ